MRSALLWLANHLCRLRRISDRVDKTSPYLDRYYLFGDATSAWFLALHRIHKSDADGALHNHPWNYYALQLAGWMWEHQPDGVHKRRPGYLRVRGRTSLHRLELPAGEVWSLFLGGPRVSTWGFASGGKLVEHETYLTAKLGAKA